MRDGRGPAVHVHVFPIFAKTPKPDPRASGLLSFPVSPPLGSRGPEYGEEDWGRERLIPGPAQRTRVQRTPHPTTLGCPELGDHPTGTPHQGGRGRGRGHFQAPEGRYLVAVAVVLLHGGSDSHRGRSNAPVELRGRAVASGEAPPPFIARGLTPSRAPPLCRDGSTQRETWGGLGDGLGVGS